MRAVKKLLIRTVVYICSKEHKHATEMKANACNIRTENARKKRQQAASKPIPVFFDDEITTQDAVDLFNASGYVAGGFFVAQLCANGILESGRTSQKGRLFIRRSSVEAAIRKLKADPEVVGINELIGGKRLRECRICKRWILTTKAMKLRKHRAYSTPLNGPYCAGSGH